MEFRLKLKVKFPIAKYAFGTGEINSMKINDTELKEESREK
jgi:hypothetical protein